MEHWDLIEISKVVRQVADALEVEISENVDPNTRQHAELTLAWHHLIDAHSLIISGRLTPDDLQWAKGEVERLGLEND